MEELKERIKYLRKSLKIGSQEKLAEILNVNGARVKSLETGRVKDLTAQEANLLVKNFNLNIDWLLTGNGEMLLNEKDISLGTIAKASSTLVNIPYFEDTYASAGGGAINYDNVPSVLSFDLTFLQSILGVSSFHNLHIIKAIGDSMEPLIVSGELLFINPVENDGNSITSGGVYVVRYYDDYLVKKIDRNSKTKELTLISENDIYSKVLITGEDLEYCTIIGRVVGHFDRI